MQGLEGPEGAPRRINQFTPGGNWSLDGGRPNSSGPNPLCNRFNLIRREFADPKLRDAALSAARPFGSEAPNRSFVAFDLARDFNGFAMHFHVLRTPPAQRIGSPDYATDKLKK